MLGAHPMNRFIITLLSLLLLSTSANAQSITISYPMPLVISLGQPQPFAGLSVVDSNSGATSDVVTISVSGTAGGTLSSNSLASGSTLTGTGPYTLTTTPSNLQADVQSLLYAPANLTNTTEDFTLSVASFQTTQLGTVTATPIELGNINITSEVPYPPPTGTFTPRNFKGVNIAGAENTYPASSGGCSPSCSYNYIYPQLESLDYWSSKNMGLIRMPLQERRIQPASYGPLDPVGRTDEPAVAGGAALCAVYPALPCQTNLLSIKKVLDRAFADGLYVVLDPHNYGYLTDTNTGVNRLIGSDAEATAQFVDWWIRVATVFENYPNVIFGLMNEPNAQTAAQWKTGAVAAINGIAQVTTSRWVFVPGTSYTGAHSWVSSGNGAAWAGYVPPAGMNIAFEMHEYLDSDFSGTHAACAGFGSSPMTAATSWANTNGFKVWIGEFGWSQDPTCPPDATALMSYMTTNEPTYLGWAYWLGGNEAFYAPWNGTSPYMYSAVPAGYPTGPFTDAPQTGILVSNLP